MTKAVTKKIKNGVNKKKSPPVKKKSSVKAVNKKSAVKKAVSKKIKVSKSSAKKGTKTIANKDVSIKKKTYPPKKMFLKNINFLKLRMPGLLQQLSKVNPLSELVWLDNGEADVAFRGIHLYNKVGVDTASKKNIEEFNDRSFRLSTGRGSAGGLDQHSLPVFQKITKLAQEKNIQMTPDAVQKKYYFLIILGFGLGKHIAELVRKYKPNHVYIFEPNMEFLHHSLSVVNWEEFLKEIDKLKATVEFATCDSPLSLAQGIASRIRTVCPPGLDSTIIHRHYESSMFDKGIKILLQDVLQTTMMGLGFFEDDMTMISHSYRNLVSGKSKIMKWLDQEKNIRTPVFIIGNGPSLDDQIDFIRENQNRAVIVSCGTALDPLLHAKIRPDFQIQIERDVGEYEVYKITAKNFDLSGINLVASTTVYPDILPMFKEAILFFRPGLSSLPLFRHSDDESLPMPDPSVSNTALSFAVHSGFREFYFFGCDMGAKSKEYHHAKKSVYSESSEELPWYVGKNYSDKLKDSFSIEVSGNFGGTVLTTDILLWTKKTLESLINKKGSGRFFYNCSDGAYIEGTSPKHVSSLFFQDIPGGKKSIVDDLMGSFPEYTGDMFDRAWERADLFKTIPALTKGLKESFKGNRSLKDKKYLTETMSLFKPGEVISAPAMLYRGSLMLLFAVCEWYLNRIPAEKDRKLLEKIIRSEVNIYLDELEDEAIGDFTKLVEDYRDCRD